ncbi:hypothetical protein [Diplocloster modestus]|uniref:Uncharacterized protein n=1 Tax=Diplocloster modestus TaxID=2850322 RepID=A0ABS6K3H7_9FIRM|nr:hypothetical protein [Diplocloster modestus]MBU9725074.1 hypothetical protein [Diplocloster modestus]
MSSKIREYLQQSDRILIGIGEEITAKSDQDTRKCVYEALNNLLTGKNYYIVSLAEDDQMLHTPFDPARIVTPLYTEEEKGELYWNTYLQWLSQTLNHDLFILELGAGFQYPQIIRFPFEKTAYFNQKSHFIRVHSKLYQVPTQSADRSEAIQADPGEWVLRI